MVGITDNSQISQSSSRGTVSGTELITGGLIVGNGNQSEVIDCYSESNVSGIAWTGGLIGLNAMNSTIIRSYSSGLTFNNQGGSQSGGLTGGNENNATISASFWDLNSSGQSTSAGTGAVGKSTAEMMDPSTFLMRVGISTNWWYLENDCRANLPTTCMGDPPKHAT